MLFLLSNEAICSEELPPILIVTDFSLEKINTKEKRKVRAKVLSDQLEFFNACLPNAKLSKAEWRDITSKEGAIQYIYSSDFQIFSFKDAFVALGWNLRQIINDELSLKDEISHWAAIVSHLMDANSFNKSLGILQKNGTMQLPEYAMCKLWLVQKENLWSVYFEIAEKIQVSLVEGYLMGVIYE